MGKGSAADVSAPPMQVKKSGSFTNMLKGSFSKKKKPVPVAQPVKEDDSPLAMVRQLSLSKMMEMENSKVGAVQSVKSVAKAPLKTQAYLLCIVSVVIAMCPQLYFGQKVAGGPSRDAHLLPGAGCLIMLAALKDKLSQK